MARLSRSDLEGVLAFVAEAAALAGEDPFTPATLELLQRLVPSEGAGYLVVDRVRRTNLEGCSSTGPLDVSSYDPATDPWWQVAHQHPICSYVEETGEFGTFKVSDFLSRSSLRALELYEVFFEPEGIEHWMMLVLPSPPWREQAFNFVRAGRDFSERDRAVLDVLQPHLLSLVRAAALRRRLAAALAALEHGGRSSGDAVVLLAPGGAVDLVTPPAARLLERYFPGAKRTTVPDQLLGAGAGVESVVAARNGTRLVAERIDGALLLREAAVESPALARLTPRERQVLEWVAEGKTNAEIAAILVVSAGTVRKHLENVYAKLGVGTRTAAVARLSLTARWNGEGRPWSRPSIAS